MYSNIEKLYLKSCKKNVLSVCEWNKSWIVFIESIIIYEK